MSKRILVIGGYGNFGAFISRRLSRDPDVKVIVAGRSATKARALAEKIGAEWALVDIEHELDVALVAARPDIVIHTAGPFQHQDYRVALACIACKCHYVDLADGREFVVGIGRLDEPARAADVAVVSGASSVPALATAVIDEYRTSFQSMESVAYGIATAQRTMRGGMATAKSVLSYAGKPFTTLIDGKMQTVYGWQGLRWRNFPGLGGRLLGNCDVPDLELFPGRYPDLKNIRFLAGLELPVIHLSLWALTWFVRFGVFRGLASAAPFMLRLSGLLDRFGTDSSGFFVEIDGIGTDRQTKRVTFDLTARSGDGPMIPCVPAVLTALKLARGEIARRGAMPCVGLVTLDALLDELKSLDIRWHVH